MARKVPPFRFRTKADATKGGKLKPGCRRIKVKGATRYLCALSGLGRRKRR